MKRAVLYLRLSAIVEDSTSIARQEADLLALCEREGWAVERVLADDGKSGRKARANAAEALRMLRDREAEVLVTWKLDRWTRQGLSAIGDLVDTLDAAPGSLFVALQDGLRSDQAAWRLVAAVLSEVARTEADNTSARARSAIAYRKTVTGRFTGGGTIPFGYRSEPAHDGVGRILVPDLVEAAIVREVAEQLLDSSATVSGIAADLTARGVPTSKSPARKARYRGQDSDGLDRGRWTASTIRSLWSSYSLLGRVSLGSDVVRDEDGLPATSWEPILDRVTLDQLRTRLGTDRQPRAPRARQARLLSGVVFCAYCDGKLYVTTSSGQPVYRCSASWNGNSAPHPSPAVNAENLESYVTARFLAVHGDSPEVERIQSTADTSTATALADVEAALRDATAALLSDDADSAALVRRLDALKSRRAQLRNTPGEVSTELVYTGRTVADSWNAGTVDHRRTLLTQALDHLTVSAATRRSGFDPSRVSLLWHS
jgi:site-specific DNA recombinase